MESEPNFTAFCGDEALAVGSLAQVLRCSKKRIDHGETRPVMVFDDATGQQLDFDWSGSEDDVLARIPLHPAFASLAEPVPAMAPEAAKSGPGRPKLGVISREVSLLPRHWEWLDGQPGGMSAALRRLVEEARKKHAPRDRARQARDAAGKFMWAMAGNLSNFEEASRALFADQTDRLPELTQEWPQDIRDYLLRQVDAYARAAALIPKDDVATEGPVRR